MIPVIPWYVTTTVIATQVAIAVAVWTVLSAAAGRSGLEPAAVSRVRTGSAAFLGAWLGGVLALAPTHVSVLAHGPFYIPIQIPLFVGGSLTAAAVSIWRSPSLRRALAAVTLPALHALQVWRVLGVIFVLLLAQGQLPAHFALPAGWGDIFVGVTAPLVALALARRLRGARAFALSWNAFGLLDLLVAVGMGTGVLAPLLVPGLGGRVPPATAMGMLPMFLVPAFAVPMSTLFHLLALGGLLREARFDARPATAGAR
jgi:hypothetical protein